jgi:hypothetical protein
MVKIELMSNSKASQAFHRTLDVRELEDTV